VSEHSEDHLAPGVFHLVSAHEVASRWRLHPAYVALCGALVETFSTAGIDCPDCECDEADIGHCPACLRAAIERNRRVGADTGTGIGTAGG
jgi:hypothetical protein